MSQFIQRQGAPDLIIVNLIGGIGNQMFQYAAGRALAAARGVPLYLDLRGFQGYKLHHGYQLGQAFDLRAPVAYAEELRQVLGWKSQAWAEKVIRSGRLPRLRGRNYALETRPQFCSYWPGFEKLPARCYLRGYWQSERYFESVAETIRTEFHFAGDMDAENLAVAERIARSRAVSLHVRRGDMANNPTALAVHGLCSLDYYQRAMDRIAQHQSDLRFFVFSDDIAWAREHISWGHAVEFVQANEGKDSYNDMRLMALCGSHIIANSSFSWWGAWLAGRADGMVIAPARWFAVDDIRAADVVPSRWIRL